MNKTRKALIGIVVAAAALAATPANAENTRKPGPMARTYNQEVLFDEPVGFWTSNVDLSGHGRNGRFTARPTATVMPNGDRAPRYNGVGQYLTIPDGNDWSVSRTGALTVEAWLRPDVLQFRDDEGPRREYVHWLGKGTPGHQEYVARMYSLHNHAHRPNRISGYAFNLSGSEGAGSYFQDVVVVGEWIHYVLVINTNRRNETYPTGYVKVYKNGELRDQDALVGFNVTPGNGDAPFRVATRDLGSFFQGAIGKVAIYGKELSAERLRRHYQTMARPTDDGTVAI
jgi:hypothetical protein